MQPDEIKLYRLTHIGNIRHVLEHGITHRNSKNANPNFISIGDLSLISTRSSKTVNVDNGVFDIGAPDIVLGDYIPFYFGVKMPMLYVIQNGGNFVAKATSAKDIIYLVCSLKRVIKSNLSYFFSDGHATDNLTDFYDKSKIEYLPDIIDWKSIKAPYWGGTENLNTKRKKQAEFLIGEDIPPDFIIGYGCYNEVAKATLIKMGIEEDKIKIIPGAYF